MNGFVVVRAVSLAPMATSGGGGTFGLREWWAATETWGRVFVIGLVVVIAALVVWALVPSQKERAIEDCVQKQLPIAIKGGETSREPTESFCETMWELSH